MKRRTEGATMQGVIRIRNDDFFTSHFYNGYIATTVIFLLCHVMADTRSTFGKNNLDT